MKHRPISLWLSAVVLTAACSDAPGPAGADQGALAALRGVVAELEARKTRLQDINDIKRLQHTYGYYIDRGMWDEAAELFADNGSIEVGLDGVYVGRERVREYLHAFGGGRAGLGAGTLNEHMQVMPVVTVAPDGTSARARWRAIVMAGGLEQGALWGEGPYENEYVKEDGRWKIRSLHWFQTVLVPYDGGWLNNEDFNGGKWASDRLSPDRPPTVEYGTWPETYLPPFHFPNPVTGE